MGARVREAPATRGGRAEVEVTFTFSASLHQTRQEEFFFVRLEGLGPGRASAAAAGLDALPVVYPEGTLRDGTEWYDSPVTLLLPIEIGSGVAAGIHALALRAGYQLCNDKGLCFLPQEVELSVDLPVAGGNAAVSGIGLWGVLRLLAMAFLGGLILNVMPCVLPVLSIKALGLVRQSGSDRRRILVSSLLYAGGIEVSFALLAGSVVALKASGELVGWGFQFQQPGYVIALLAVVFVFALSLFDVYTLGVPAAGLAARAARSGGHLGSFLTGAMAVLLATPCTAPLLGTALGYAFSQPPGIILAMFLSVGLGLAFPFVLLGFWPSLVQRLPKPGAWTGVFRSVMGFLLVGTAVYLLDVLAGQLGSAAVIRVLIFLAVLAFSAWVYGRFGGPTVARWKRWTALAAAAAIAVSGGVATLRFEVEERAEAATESAEIDLPAGWEAFDPRSLASYRAAGQPVLLAFGARWCWTCRVNESAVLSAAEVREALAEAGVRLVYGDYTRPDDEVGEWLRRFGRAGVPLYVYYPPGEGAEPVLLPELLTRRMVLGLLEE